jgi:hypothetical protein
MVYYDARASNQKKLANLLSLAIIAAGSIIGFLSVMKQTPPNIWDVLIALTGLAAAVAQAILRIWRFDETWILHRNSAELLRRELRVYRNALGDYADLDEEAARRLFASNAEEIIALEQNQYFQEVRKAKGRQRDEESGHKAATREAPSGRR